MYDTMETTILLDVDATDPTGKSSKIISGSLSRITFKA